MINLKRIIRTMIWLPYLMYLRLRNMLLHDIKYAECSVEFLGYGVKKNNWGDDLNYYFIGNIIKDKICFIPYSRLACKKVGIHYILIGSILGFYNLDNSIVFGSGIMNPYVQIKGNPKQIISVRGPKTRNVLMENGIECPENYGDPALLLPCFYNPTTEKKNIVLIIPNMGTDVSVVKGVLDKIKGDDGIIFKILDLTRYEKWTNPIDSILEAQLVVSESLHGLIVAETYGVPSIWVEFKEHQAYWNFKYEDFYESINKQNQVSVKMYRNEMIDINYYIEKWKKGDIDYKKILEMFPFEIIPNKKC